MVFGMIRKALGGGGGIDLKLELPEYFVWPDAVIALTVRLRGHKTEPRTVNTIDFSLYEEDLDKTDTTGPAQVSHRWTFEGPLSIAPASEASFDIEMPLPYTEEDDRGTIDLSQVKSQGLGQSVMHGLFRSVDKGPTIFPRYIVTATARVEGAKIGVRDTGKIRYGTRSGQR